MVVDLHTQRKMNDNVILVWGLKLHTHLVMPAEKYKHRSRQNISCVRSKCPKAVLLAYSTEPKQGHPFIVAINDSGVGS